MQNQPIRINFQLTVKDYLKLVVHFHRVRLITFGFFIFLFEVLVITTYVSREIPFSPFIFLLLLAMPAVILLIYFNLRYQSKRTFVNDPVLTKPQEVEIDAENLKVKCSSGENSYKLDEMYAYIFTAEYAYLMVSPVKIHIIPLNGIDSVAVERIRGFAAAKINNQKYLKARRNGIALRLLYFIALMIFYVYMITR